MESQPCLCTASPHIQKHARGQNINTNTANIQAERRNLYDIEFSNDVLGLIQEHRQPNIYTATYTLNSIKLRTCTSKKKYIYQRVEKTVTRVKKICTNHMSGKDLPCKIYKGVINSTAKGKVKQVFKMVAELKHEFQQRRNTKGQQACEKAII